MGIGSARRLWGRRGSQPSASDEDLARMWLEGDAETACDIAHRRYATRLEGVAQRILGNHADAQDVVQKVFVSLRRSGYEGRSSLWTYLYRSAINGSVNVLRSQRRREAAERNLLEQKLLYGAGAARVAGPESKVLEGEILAAVAKALLHVKAQHRRVLVLRIVHGMTNTEIAQLEDLPAATVGTWLRRGREELQRGLRPLLQELGRTPR